MRQQEANQFDKGMSLDTNPIAMDNHTLASALNATMITMNGNELVLQNDMGNAKVESAYLPSGFVPVGVKEFGGIVYVASYNPFSKQSQIGSFPSPERNIAGDELGSNNCVLDTLVDKVSSNYIETTVNRVLLIEGPIRPGDKFIVQGSSAAVEYLRTNTANNLITFKVVVVDSDGASVDITSDMVAQSNGSQPNFIYTGSDVNQANFSVFKSKIAGSIYLQESLVLPSYISVNISGTELDSGKIKVSFYPQAYDSEGNKWTLNNPNYAISVKQDGTAVTVSNNTCEIERITGSILEYTITPYYSYGKIGVLEKSGSINVDQIGSGIVEFGSFRYYNDMLNDTLSLEYDIKSYLAEGVHYLDSVVLEAYDAESWVITNGALSVGNKISIDLSTSNSFGSFSELITFGASNETIQKGHMYLARIAVLRKSLEDSAEKEYTTDWFVIITSALANDYYIDHPTESMIRLDETVSFLFDWKLKWTQKQVSDIYKDTQTENTTDPLPVEKPNIMVENVSTSGICLETERVGSVVEQFVPEITIDTGDDFFPFETKAKLTTVLKEKTWNTSELSTVGELKADSILKVTENIDVSESEGDANSIWLKNNTTDDTNTTTIELGYKLLSQYFAKLASNGLGSGDTNKLTFESNSCTALIPYLSTIPEYEDTLEKMVGAIPFIDEATGDIQPSAWFSFVTYKSKKKKSRSVKIGIMNSAAAYTNLEETTGDIPENGKTDDDGNYGVFSSSSENQSWKYYSQYTLDYVKNTLKVNPTIFMWQGCGDKASVLWENNSKKSTYNFSIPILFDATGEMYVLNQYKTTVYNNNLLYDIVNTFSNIYVSQQGQSIAFDYYKSSSSISDYVYTNPYSATINLNFETKAELDDSTIVGNGQTVTFEGKTLSLPKFNLVESVDMYTPEIIVNSFDQLDEDVSYLEAEPQVESIAIIKDTSGDGYLVDKAYTLDKTQEKLNQAHVYYLSEGSGKDAKLIDCNKYEIPLSATNPGKYIARAFFDKKLKVVYDSSLDMNIIILNKSRLSGDILASSSISIGTEKEKMKIHEIARKHLVNLTLFEGNNIKTIKT